MPRVLTLALVVDRTADRCTLRVLGEPDVRRAGWSDPFRPRAGSLGPGSLVAVDVAAAPPVVVWRWFPATVLAVDEGGVRLDEPHHGVIDAAAVVPAPSVGEAVHVTTVPGRRGLADRRARRPAGARAGRAARRPGVLRADGLGLIRDVLQI